MPSMGVRAVQNGRVMPGQRLPSGGVDAVGDRRVRAALDEKPRGCGLAGLRTGGLQRRRGRRCTRLSSWEPPEARTQRRHALYGRCATHDPGTWCDQPGHIRLLAQSPASPDAAHEASLKSSCTGWPSLRQAQGKQRLTTPFSGSSAAVRASQLLSAGGRAAAVTWSIGAWAGGSRERCRNPARAADPPHGGTPPCEILSR
jgi:hypothetical protein